MIRFRNENEPLPLQPPHIAAAKRKIYAQTKKMLDKLEKAYIINLAQSN